MDFKALFLHGVIMFIFAFVALNNKNPSLFPIVFVFTGILSIWSARIIWKLENRIKKLEEKTQD